MSVYVSSSLGEEKVLKTEEEEPLFLGRLALSWTVETMSSSPSLPLFSLSLFFFFFWVSEQRNLIPPAFPLPFLIPLLLLPQGQPTVCPRGCLSMGGDEEESRTGLFRFGRQQWTSVCADGLLQHMVPTCLPVSLYPCPPPPIFLMCLCLYFFAYSCVPSPCLTQTCWED